MDPRRHNGWQSAENVYVQKREKEAKRNECNKEAAKFFHSSELYASRHRHLLDISSNQMRSQNPVTEESPPEEELQLEERRQQLKKLLTEEQAEYEHELQQLEEEEKQKKMMDKGDDEIGTRLSQHSVNALENANSVSSKASSESFEHILERCSKTSSNPEVSASKLTETKGASYTISKASTECVAVGDAADGIAEETSPVQTQLAEPAKQVQEPPNSDKVDNFQSKEITINVNCICKESNINKLSEDEAEQLGSYFSTIRSAFSTLMDLMEQRKRLEQRAKMSHSLSDRARWKSRSIEEYMKNLKPLLDKLLSISEAPVLRKYARDLNLRVTEVSNLVQQQKAREKNRCEDYCFCFEDELKKWWRSEEKVWDAEIKNLDDSAKLLFQEFQNKVLALKESSILNA